MLKEKMLKEKKELVSYLKTRCGSLVFNFDVATCTIEEDNISIDYCFYDVRGERVCFVSVLKE